MSPEEHLDRALAEEFAGHGSTIHRLKVSNPHFHMLMVRNHAIWTEIQGVQSGLQPASQAYLDALEKQRLQVLDEIAGLVAAFEN